MTHGGWRYVAASVVGTSHEKSGGICQDANGCQIHLLPNGENVFVAAVADGAGSAPCGAEGAARTCSSLLGLITDHLNSGSSVDEITLDTTKLWINTIQRALDDDAMAASRDRRGFRLHASWSGRRQLLRCLPPGRRRRHGSRGLRGACLRPRLLARSR